MAYKIEFKGKHLTGILTGLFLLTLNLSVFQNTMMFGALLLISLGAIIIPFLLDYFAYNKREKEIEERFPDFVRNLVSAIRSGMPISRAVIYVSRTDYGPLNYYIKKMANQIEWHIPVKKVLLNFSEEVRSPMIKRALATVLEAEKSGGNIEDVLASITDSLLTIKKLRQERKASIQGQITQSYVIFFIFLGVLLTIQNVLIPYLSSMESPGTESITGQPESQALSRLREAHSFDFSTPQTTIRSIAGWFTSLSGIFMMLAIFQSFFAGIVLGKMAEGDYKSGLRHSFLMMFVAIVILTVANTILSATL